MALQLEALGFKQRGDGWVHGRLKAVKITEDLWHLLHLKTPLVTAIHPIYEGPLETLAYEAGLIIMTPGYNMFRDGPQVLA